LGNGQLELPGGFFGPGRKELEGESRAAAREEFLDLHLCLLVAERHVDRHWQGTVAGIETPSRFPRQECFVPESW
jgi:hypothetical protein